VVAIEHTHLPVFNIIQSSFLETRIMSLLLKSLVAITLLAAVSDGRCLPRTSAPTLSFKEVDNSGASPLPEPTGTLKQVVLGVGFQLYKCAATGTYVQNVPQAGAYARLYDITGQVEKSNDDDITQAAAKAFEACVKQTRCTSPSSSNGYCEKCYRMGEAAARMQSAGLHYFEPVNGVQSPSFDMSAVGEYFSGKKAGGAKAPSSAYDGSNGLGAIDWLYLVDHDSGRTHGLTSVYRVQTAGGVAPKSCTPGSSLQVPYATEYWMYQ
jgi:hypothetical protein